MDAKYIEARELIIKAREALRRGDRSSAWKLGEQAALLAPELEDAWLILAASDPDPQEALAYARKAQEINPASPRAQRAVEWSMDQLKPTQIKREMAVSLAQIAPIPVEPRPESKVKSRDSKLIYAALFLGLLTCAVLAFAAYSAVTHPAFASILNRQPVPTKADHWAVVDVAKPSVTPIEASAFTSGITPTAPVKVTNTPRKATSTPTERPTEEPSATPAVTETPAALAMEMVADTPTMEHAAPPPSAPLPDIARSGNGVRWIDIDLTNQAVYAYEGDVAVNSFIVSTGTWLTPTVTGQYKVYVKYRYDDMSGPGYFLPDVPYVMYFYKGYGLHGTYWHNNFGTPMSHGCINLRTDDAAWLFDWASVGTVVNVHY
jgi:lipoprotein-anchoring transpeptidase ErfK/SrfK